MKRIYLGMRYLVLTLLLFGYVAHAQQPVLVKVQVRDTKTLNALPGANVIVTSTLVDKRELLTDSFGRVAFFIADSETVELFSSAGDYYDSKILLVAPDSAVKHVTLSNVPFDYNRRSLYIGFFEGTDSLQAFGQELIDSLGLMLAKQKRTLILTVEGIAGITGHIRNHMSFR